MYTYTFLSYLFYVLLVFLCYSLILQNTQVIIEPYTRYTDTCDTGSTQFSQVEQTAVVHNVRASVT